MSSKWFCMAGRERSLACATPSRSADSRSSFSASRALYIASELRKLRSAIRLSLLSSLSMAAAERCSLR